MTGTPAPRDRAALRVLLIVHNRAGVGPFPKIVEMAKGLASHGTAVTLLCTAPHAHIRLTERSDDGVRIIESPDLLAGRLRQGIDPWNTLRRLWLVEHERFDVVHAIDCRPAVIFPALWARRRGAALVLSWWDLFGGGGTAHERSGALYAATLGWIEGFFETRFRRYADRATVVTMLLASRLRALGYPLDRTLLQRVGTDTRRFAPIEKREARRRLDLPHDATICCHVGTLFPADRALLLDALAIAGREANQPLLTVLVGGGDAAPPSPTLRTVGRQADERLWLYLCAADLCLLPQRVSLANRARWPSKVGDYFSAGRPLVATRVSDLGELVPQHGLGFLAEADTPKAYAAALGAAIAAQATWDQLGIACRRFAESELDVARLTRTLLDFYAAARRDRQGAGTA